MRAMDATDLTDALHDLRWKQVDLARKLGVHVNTVSSWATGSAMVPKYAAEYLRVVLLAKEVTA